MLIAAFFLPIRQSDNRDLAFVTGKSCPRDAIIKVETSIHLALLHLILHID